MSATLEQPATDPAIAAGDDAETRARRMGWVPKEEFRGSPERWVPAEEFVRIGEEHLGVARERGRSLERQLAQSTRETRQVVELLQDMRAANMRTEQRAYERAKAELVAARDQAVAAGDTAGFQQAQQQVDALEKEKPPPVPQPAPRQNGVDPEIVAWTQKQTWWGVNKLATDMAVAAHGRLLQDRPELSAGENLHEVETIVRRAFPGEFRVAPPAPADPPAPEPNPRRDEPAAVASGSSGGQPRRSNGKPQKIADLPHDEQADARRGYEKAKRWMHDFTEKEYVENYGS